MGILALALVVCGTIDNEIVYINVELKSENNLNSLMQLQTILVFPFFQCSSLLYRYDLLHTGQNCTMCILLQHWQTKCLSNQIMFIHAVIQLNPMKSMRAFPVAVISQIY